MAFDDMVNNFDILSICHMAGDCVKAMAAKGAEIENWTPHEFHGIWPGAGCVNAGWRQHFRVKGGFQSFELRIRATS
jgi:hypothetical protein